MKSFALDENGDVLIENNEITMAHGTDLLLQTIKSVLATKKGEWFLDWEEGIDHSEILGKHEVDNDIIKSEIQDGITQVDENLVIDDFESEYDKKTRKLKLKFTVINSETGETAEIEENWG